MARDARDAREYLDQAPPDVRASAEAVITLFEMAAARTRGDARTVSDKASEVLEPAGADTAPVGRGRAGTTG